jgi:hypothetical protein
LMCNWHVFDSKQNGIAAAQSTDCNVLHNSHADFQE